MAEPLKNQLDRTTVEVLAERFAKVHPEFNGPAFIAEAMSRFPELELKNRVNLVADLLADHLPDDYPTALSTVVAVAETDPGAWASWPLCSFVERHGLDHPTESLDAMHTLTRRWSCEFAIRPFLDHHLDETRRHLRRWVDDPDEAVRRLASEGTRPLLPWGPKVQAILDDPEIGLELLRALRNDDSEAVRRSVANHLNDLAKSDAELVVATITEWMIGERPIDERMVRRALRTLVKRGHTGALRLLGFTVDPQIEIEAFECRPASVELGERIELTARLRSTADSDQLLVIDFVIHHVTASGGTTPKVFKWATPTVEPGQTLELSKKRLVQTASTRRYHRGLHRVDLQVAGRVVASAEFHLRQSSPPR
ncbi:MAG: DNA alkylation repair protein [Acidimicrobiales bacterium]